ncbi:lysylphosphatidylglycerol synthase transmembrane domain-containing protein [Wenyingzhuangia sp. chi5]|uniref:Lysylphosphatidylglycerol synthase transmembrane domain-containing protein n=1 Tax=Wenyingzhuangia gilva TaxID=3057677 RepID=A0ABT8VR16_9FLAO|nr:lysylphosphatidylglycerol synthase transmembrane domain-containing protein [Wenyingzhuangia sp. chi5]MDO3694409.1 lysylphosphatidylglycerol synthase transmembrane domain-containing protein [Wenyingzhuangia sp. chi5]
MKKNKLKKIITTVLKIGVSVLLFYFVLTKISFVEIFKIIKNSDVFLLILSGVFLLLSQWVSSIRLNTFFHSLGYHLSNKSNHVLYLIGMFYNFFIPGGIGGDAYKVYKLHKKFDWNVKKLSAAIFVDRFSGLTTIGMLLVLLMIPFVKSLDWISSSLILIALATLLLVLIPFMAYALVQKLFPSFKKVYLKTLLLSIVVQTLQLICVYFLVLNFHVVSDLFSYLLVFLISVILSIVSFAGIGVREFVFYQAADLLHYNKDVSVAIGLLFTFLTAILSLIGGGVQLKKVNLSLQEKK